MAALRVYLVGAVIAALPLAVLAGARPDSRTEPQGHSGHSGVDERARSQPTVVSLARGSDLGTPAVVSDPVVGTVALWPKGTKLEHRVLPPDGVWEPRRALPRGPVRGLSSSVAVAGDGRGRVVAAWLVKTGLGKSWLLTARRSLNGEWSTPKVMDEFVSSYEWNALSIPSLAMGGDGSTVLTWVVELTDPSDEGSRSRSRLHAMYRPPHGRWQPIRFPSRREEGAVADIDDRGVAVFVTYKDGAPRLVRCDSARCVRGKRLPNDWPSGVGIEDVDVSGDGTSTSLLLSKMVHQGGGSVVFAAHRDNSGWSAPVRVSPPPEDETYYDAPRQVMHDHTTTILVGGWGVCACPMRLQVTTRDEGDDYSAPLTIAEGEDLTPLGLWVNEDGAALAVWDGDVDLEDFSAASYRSSSDGTWSDPVVLPAAADGKVLAGTVRASGGALVLWHHRTQVWAWTWPATIP